MNTTRASSNTPIQTRFFSTAISPIPGNIEQVTKVEERVSLFQNQIFDLPNFTFLHKTLKAARLAIADTVIINCTNTEWLVVNHKKTT